MVNSSLYIFGAAALEAGSIAFYPGVMDNVTCNGAKPCALGQYLYVAGSLVVCFALLWVSNHYVLNDSYYFFMRSSHRSIFNVQPNLS